MKMIILGDTHFGLRGDSLNFHRYYEKFFDEVFFPFIDEHKIDIIFQLGDLFDRRKYINFNSLYLTRKYFFDRLKDRSVKLHTLLGNHCVFYKNTLYVNSSQLLLNEYENITVYNEPTTIQIDEINIDIIPWICDDNNEQTVKFLKNSRSEICFGHFELAGFEMDRGNICNDGFDKSKLSKYDVVLSGHFHHKSTDGQITYVGTPIEMTWADHNDKRGFHVFDTETRELTFVPNPYRMFHKISYDDTQQDFDYWKNFEYGELKDCYTKIIVVNKQNPYLFDTVVENLYKVEVAHITIVEDIVDTELEDDEIIKQAEDTITILNKFIDGLTLNVESDKLKKIMRELYVESLTTETTE